MLFPELGLALLEMGCELAVPAQVIRAPIVSLLGGDLLVRENEGLAASPLGAVRAGARCRQEIGVVLLPGRPLHVVEIGDEMLAQTLDGCAVDVPLFREVLEDIELGVLLVAGDEGDMIDGPRRQLLLDEFQPCAAEFGDAGTLGRPRRALAELRGDGGDVPALV